MGKGESMNDKEIIRNLKSEIAELTENFKLNVLLLAKKESEIEKHKASHKIMEGHYKKEIVGLEVKIQWLTAERNDMKDNVIPDLKSRWEKTYDIRPELLDFAMSMERKLKEKDPKKGDTWKSLNTAALGSLLIKEHDEWLKDHTQKETVDIANVCMMLWNQEMHELSSGGSKTDSGSPNNTKSHYKDITIESGSPPDFKSHGEGCLCAGCVLSESVGKPKKEKEGK